MEDLLGFDRFEQHTKWACSGTVEGRVDAIEPRAFVVERHHNRWLLTTADGGWLPSAMTLETGIWTLLMTSGFSIVVTQLVPEPPAMAAPSVFSTSYRTSTCPTEFR